MKIRERFSKIGTSINQLLKEYPITLLIIAITTLLVVIDIEGNWEWLGFGTIVKIVAFASIWAVGTFWTEICVKDKVNKTVSFIVTGIISFIFIKILYHYDDMFGISSAIVHENLLRVLVCYVISILLVSIYKLVKKSELSFSDYILRVFANAFITGVMYAVLALGVLLLALIFVSLILGDDSIELIFRSQMLLLGLFYIPSIMYSLTTVKEKEISNIIKNLVYVLLILVTVAMAIIYMYIIKIIIQQEMPENFVYRIIATIFVFAFPVWIMASNYKDKSKFVSKLTNILPYAFIPLVILELYSIGLRIADYGLTPNRYICVAFALLQIIAIVLCVYKKQAKLNHICMYALAITVIATISPLNMQYVSNLSQKSILENNLKEGTELSSLDKDTQAKVRGAYRYIKALSDSDKYMPEYLKNNDELKNELGISVTYNIRHIYYSNTDEEVNVSGYDSLRNIFFSGSGNDIKLSDSYNLDITKIKEYVKQILEQQEGTERNYISKNKEIQINENAKIIITYISISCYGDNDEAEYVSIQGYLLTKNK